MCQKMDGPGDHQSELNKPDSEDPSRCCCSMNIY